MALAINNTRRPLLHVATLKLKSLKHAIESQTTLCDIASIRSPIEMVLGSLDEFQSEGVTKIVTRMTRVTVHRVRGSDHLTGKRLARAVAAAIDSAPPAAV